MNTRLLRKIIGLILAALLLTSIVLLAGTSVPHLWSSLRPFLGSVRKIRSLQLLPSIRLQQWR